MDHGNDDFVAAIAIMVIFGAPVAAWIVSRVFAHNERMEMIRRGMVPPPSGIPPMPGAGYGPMPPPPPPPGKRGYPPPAGYFEDYYYAQRQLRKGITITCIGLALLIGLGSIGPLAGISYVGPWLLGGLVPMFVGIAQIVNAVLNGARLPGFGPGSGFRHTTFGPPPPPPGSSPQPPGGPYAWRPGPTPEIERPVQPPDQR
ncbi:MAG TPA: hypothetical protein VMF11_04240 [Candidatus Baltobacteraceae bacterium]|nr:hypothetical protein [Candidatus Baltobacteraceae bacterium]